jgi:hypothetical protein
MNLQFVIINTFGWKLLVSNILQSNVITHSIGTPKAVYVLFDLVNYYYYKLKYTNQVLDQSYHCKKLAINCILTHTFYLQSSKQRSTAKLTTLVDFPLYGFDMTPHLASRSRVEGGGVPGGLGWSPWKRPRRQTSRHEDNVYDLYAICNHHGQDLQGGHYTGKLGNLTLMKLICKPLRKFKCKKILLCYINNYFLLI